VHGKLRVAAGDGQARNGGASNRKGIGFISRRDAEL